MSEHLTCLSSMATRSLLADLARFHEDRSGVRLRIESVGGVDAARRVRAGEGVDLVVLASRIMETLEAEGFIAAGSQVALARSFMAAAVRAGRPRPDVSNEDALKQAMLDAPSIAYSTGPSGDMLKTLWAKWGIGDELAGRVVQAPPGIPVASLLERGEAEIGFQQLSELAGAPGIDIVGRLPAELGTDTVFTAGRAATCRQAEAADGVLAFMTSGGTAEVKRRHGMDAA